MPYCKRLPLSMTDIATQQLTQLNLEILQIFTKRRGAVYLTIKRSQRTYEASMPHLLAPLHRRNSWC